MSVYLTLLRWFITSNNLNPTWWAHYFNLLENPFEGKYPKYPVFEALLMPAGCLKYTSRIQYGTNLNKLGIWTASF